MAQYTAALINWSRLDKLSVPEDIFDDKVSIKGNADLN